MDSVLSLYQTSQHESVPAIGHDPRAYVAQLLEIDAAQFSTVEAFLARNLHLLEVNHPSPQLLKASYERIERESFVSELIENRFLQVQSACQSWDRESLQSMLTALVADIQAKRQSTEAQKLGEQILGEQEQEPKQEPKQIQEVVNSEGKASSESQTAANRSLMRWLRWALAGSRPGPTILDTMLLLGREMTLQRFDLALKVARTQV